MRKHSVVNTYYISQGMRVTKVSNSKSDIQGHSRSLLLVQLYKPNMITVFRDNSELFAESGKFVLSNARLKVTPLEFHQDLCHH